MSLTLDAVNHPLQDAHVFAVTRPHKFTVVPFTEPVDAVNRRHFGATGFELVSHVEPVLEVVAHVVAHEGQHGEWVAAHHALLASGGSGGLRAHGGSHVNTFGPVASFGHQRHGGGAAAAEDERVNGHAVGVVPLAVQRWVVGGGHRKAGVGVSGFGASLFSNGWCPVFALPVDQVVWQLAGVFFHTFPPHVPVVGQRDVGVNDVFVQAGHAVGVGVEVGARSDAKVASLWVDGVQLAVRVGLDPGDIVTDGGDFPAFKALGWHQHGEIGFATSARKGCCHVILFALRIGHPQDEHMLGQPALVAAHVGRDAQGKALLAQQRIAAVA